ncbi:MAG: tetratricopeptide repeat protein [Planctomycetes bacterium]|nr:tetratricopeptide repeat protein [Planctomycetota bacterium]
MLMPESKSPDGQVARMLLRAERLGRLGRWSAADDCYARAVVLDQSPTSRITFGGSLATRERYHEAICHLTSALDMVSPSGDREALAAIFHNLAAIYRDLGDADLARRFQQRAIQQMEECGPTELLGLASDAWLSRRTELAKCLSAACSELEQEGDEDLILQAQATLGIVTGMTDNPREGVRLLTDACRQHRAARQHRLIGIDLMNLAILVSNFAWYRAEIHFVRQAIRHFELAPAPVSAVRARQILSNLERAQSLREFDPSVN